MTNYTAEQLLRGVPEEIMDNSWVKDAIELLRERESAQVFPQGHCVVTKEDANNYCLILRALGMEEEGDPVARVRELAAANESAPVVKSLEAKP